MEDLDNNWILLNKEVVCANDDDNSPATLGLKNMRGVFIVVGVGILLGLVLIVVEIVYKRHQMGKIKRIAAARKAATKWRGSVEVGDEKQFRSERLRDSVGARFTQPFSEKCDLQRT